MKKSVDPYLDGRAVSRTPACARSRLPYRFVRCRICFVLRLIVEKRKIDDCLLISIVVCCFVQPISQWTSTQVVEWMAALNLYRYAELFRSKDIKGVDLLSLDKDKLAVNISFLLFMAVSDIVSISAVPEWR